MENRTKKVLGVGALLGCGAVGLLAGGTALLFAVLLTGVDREIVTTPAATLTVTDEDGAPIAGAAVRFEWSSAPHHVVHRVDELRTDAHGALTMTATRETETVMPFCMHGVPEHGFELCIEADGKAPVTVALATTDDPVALTIPLRDWDAEEGEPPLCATARERPLYRAPRDDIASAHANVLHANELHTREPTPD